MDLFLSHVEEDALLVKELEAALEASGFSCWNYTKDSQPVIAHQDQTSRAIEEAAGFVLVISPNTLEHPTHVDREIRRAAELGKPFVPLLSNVPFGELAERQPAWEAALKGAVAVSIPPDGLAGVVSMVARSLRQLGIQPSIPTVIARAEPAPGRVDRPDIAFSYFDEDFLTATELADALEALGYSTWYYERDFLRGKAPAGVAEPPSTPRVDDPVRKLTDQILHDALRQAAAEIYFEPGEQTMAVHFRLDGIRREAMRIPATFGPQLLARLKELAHLRVSLTPAPHGERAVIRLADSSTARKSIAGARAVVVLVGDEVPIPLDSAELAGKPLLLVTRQGEGKGPAGTVTVTLREGVTPTFVEELVGRLREAGIAPGGRPMRIQLVLGDITEQKVDAIVNAANSTLLGGGGVDGAIHRKGGPQILQECKQLRRHRYPEGLPTGEAAATTGGRLPAAWVIHTVGPIYGSSNDPAGELAACYRNSLRIADELGAKSIAFPAISTGAFGYPMDQAAEVAIKAVRETAALVELVRFVVFDRAGYEAYERALSGTG